MPTVAFHVYNRVGPRRRSHEARSLPLQYGPDVALSTLSSCRYLHEPKTRFPVGGWPLPGRESHPLDAPGLSWRAVDAFEEAGVQRVVTVRQDPAHAGFEMARESFQWLDPAADRPLVPLGEEPLGR